VSRLPQVGVVDLGLGNLFSVLQACAAAGLQGLLVDQPHQLSSVDGVILPGVGSFPTAMMRVRERRLDRALCDLAGGSRPLFGVCLGLQLLFASSEEFGETPGLGLLQGRVRPIGEGRRSHHPWRVPNVGWSPVVPPKRAPVPEGRASAGERLFADPMMASVPVGSHMYFVHSFVAVPDDDALIVAEAPFSERSYCAAVRNENIFACQFHPERSAHAGLSMYASFASALK
jgi:imidazole glycerol-phosphate synthase subunit HisH